MGSSAIWYKNFLNNTVVQCSFDANVSRSTTCYALQLSQIEFKELPHGSVFELHLFFYDTTKKQFFGRQWSSNVQIASGGNNSLKFNQTVFFHSSISDERVVLVCEVVKKEKDPWVLGWTVIPIFSKNQPITDYSTSNMAQFLGKRFQLYKGSSKCLRYVNLPLESNQVLVKQDAILACILQTHDKMLLVIDYIPEFFIVGNNDIIPGLQAFTGTPQLKQPELAPVFTAILDNIQVTYSAVNSSQVDAAILEAMNRERCYKANKPFNDSSIPKLTIIERRIKIGIHNGLCYVEEPLYLLLTDSEPFGRRRSRSLSRSSKGSVQNSDFYQTRNNARLYKLCADERFALVFALDYLIGVERTENSVLDAQLVMICWNAWCPFKNGSFTLADTINVPLVGGPRPNPDDVLCFKNLLILGDMTNNALNQIEPKLHLRFNFAVVEAMDNRPLSQLPTRLDTKAQIENTVTPQPKPDITAHFEPDSVSESRQIKVSNVDLTPKLNEVYTPLQKSKSVPALNSSAESSYQDDLNVDETMAPRISGFSRASNSYFTNMVFPPILSRSGKPAPFIETSTIRPINMELELNSRLDTHEIVIQFMAISTFKNAYISNLSRSARYFFTLRFYRFESITTEMLLAHPSPNLHRNDPVIFQRLDENGRLIEPQSNGFMLKFTVERSSMHANDGGDLVNYLYNANLCIDTWNADSLMHIGNSIIPLKTILRQASDAIQLNVQCPIVQNGFSSESTTTGLLFLRLGNIGHPSHNQLDVYESRNKSAVISHRMSRLNQTGQVNQRARPLSAINETALQRFINTQKLDIQQRKEEIFGSESIYRLKKWDELKKQQPTMPKATLKRFIFEEELEAYRTLRRESKSSQLLKAVFKSITTNYSIFAKAGQTEFFEYSLKNTFAEPIICLIDINDNRLSVIKNADEWKFYKDAKRIKSPVERDLFHSEDSGMLSLYLNALETVNIPFKYDPFVGQYQMETSPNQAFEIKAIFKRSDTEEPLSILEIFIQNRGHALENSFRWFCEENSRCAKLLRLHAIQGSKRALTLRSTDPNVLCSLRNAPNGGQELLITCYAPESPFCRDFIIMMYSDRYFYNQIASWGFSLHGMQKLNVDAIQAQTSKIPLIFRQPKDRDTVVSFRSSSECVAIAPSGDVIADGAQLSEVKAVLVPNFSGKRTVLITAVDSNLRKLLNAWILMVRSQEPNIVKSYEIEIPLGQQTAVIKKISIENPYTIERNYRIHTSNLQLVSVENEYVKIESNGKAMIDLIFYPISALRATTTNVLVFVENASNGQPEEAYSLQIKYA